MGPNNEAMLGTHEQGNLYKIEKRIKPNGKKPTPKRDKRKHVGKHEGRKASTRPLRTTSTINGSRDSLKTISTTNPPIRDR